MVEEGLRRAEDDVAVDVVLEVLDGLVADAHRPHAAIPGRATARLLGERLLEADAVERLDVAAARAAHDVVQPAQIVLHRADFGQAVERATTKKASRSQQ